MHASPARGFTLIELLLVIAVIVALAVTVFVALNPAQRLAAARDSKRLSDVASFQSALNLYTNDAALAGQVPFVGTSSIIYVSIPDPTATTTAGTNCAGIGLTGNYHCPASSTYQSVNGTGWIPINFNSVATPSLGQLPIDPTNTTSSGEYYMYSTDGTGNWEILAVPEAQANQSNTMTFITGTSKSLIVLSKPITVILAGSGSWTVPSGVTSTYVTVIGAGGGGGGSWQATSGGGGGGSATLASMSTTPGAGINYSVGTGGAGDRNWGQAGGNTWFGGSSSTPTIVGYGGTPNGGTGGLGGSGAGTGATIYSSGNSCGGCAGAGGAGSGGGGGNGTVAGTGGAGGAAGSGVAGGAGGAWNGGAGNTPGGGGSGASYLSSSGGIGGNGANGEIFILYNYNYIP